MRFPYQWLLVALLATIFAHSAAHAMIMDSSAAGFTLRFEAKTKQSAEKSYKALTNSIDQWWSSEHTYTGDAKNMYIEDHQGGCFCERLPAGGGIVHMTVVYAAPGSLLRMRGSLGPLQELATVGAMTWEFSAVEGATRVRLWYAVGGYAPDGLASMASIVDRVVGEQFTRFARYLDTGSPEPARATEQAQKP